VQVSPARPRVGKALAGPTTDIDSQIGLFGEGMERANRLKRHDFRKGLIKALASKADCDNRFTGRAPWPPVSILIVAADGPRQAVAGTEVIDGPGFAIVVREDGGLGPLASRERMIGAADHLRLLLPAKHVAKELRQLGLRHVFDMHGF